MKKIITWSLVKRKVADLIPAEYNPRKLSEKARADLKASIEEFGKVEPLVINVGDVVIGGHQRLTIYADLKITEVDVMMPDRKLSKSEEKALNIRLNKNVGEWDGEKLKKFFNLDELTAARFEESEAKAFFGLSDANDMNIDEDRMQILAVQPPESPSLKEKVSIRFKNKAEYDQVKAFLKSQGGGRSGGVDAYKNCKMKKLKYFSTFTGIGGLDMGLEKMGAECVGFSEIKETSIKIYQRHYPDHKCFGDITKIDPKKLPDFDVFTGGFPCQSFSLAGARKGFGDRRGAMIFYIYDILLEKKPEFVVLENVKGIAMHDHGRTYKNIFKLLSSAGYSVRVVLLNSAHYGSPQARERVVFLCRRGKDFLAKYPQITDDTKRFRDVRSEYEPRDILSEKSLARLHATKGLKGFEMVGGYDRVNTLTTGVSSSGRSMLITQDDEIWRKFTCLEAERLQGFPDGWTEGESVANRWFALGNAVNCKVSEYLFGDYLKDLWW